MKIERMVPLAIALALVAPALVLRLGGGEVSPIVAVVLYSAAIIGAALLLAWGTELAQLELPPGLAIALLAFIAILPEYAVDLLFAYQAGTDPERGPLALANMTGANRLLIGVGWSLVVLCGALGSRKKRKRERAEGAAKQERYALVLGKRSSIDVFVLAAVSIYTLSFIVRKSLGIADAVILFAAFGFYVWRLRSAPKSKPQLAGPSAAINKLSRWKRNIVTIVMMTFAAGVILLVAKPFSDGLVDAGKQLGIDEFLMVQWVAPFATETAELVPAAIFAYRQANEDALGTLLSSKINQWTLLVGGVPLAYMVAHGGPAGLALATMQREELFLTAAQSVFAVTFLADDLKLDVREALVIAGLFLADFATSIALAPDLRQYARVGFAVLYLVLSGFTFLRARHHLQTLTRTALFRPLG